MVTGSLDTAKIKALVAKAVDQAALDGAEVLLEAANRTVPLEEGDLGRSGDTDVEKGKASVYYDSVYAARQHEETEWKHDPGRRAKWLEMAAREEVANVQRAMGEALKKAFR